MNASTSWADAAPTDTRLPPGLHTGDGQLDPATASALIDHIGSLHLTAARWVGYADSSVPEDGHRDGDYTIAPFNPASLLTGHRLPEFCWDQDHTFAWGTRLYPDSLVIAAAQPIYRHLATDTRLDTAGIIPDRDTLPLSAGD